MPPTTRKSYGRRNKSATAKPRRETSRSADSRLPRAARGAPAAGERLQKVIASAGIASRRESEQLILEGRVEVDGEIVSELGTRVDPAAQEIRVDGEQLSRPKLLYFAVHKPAGVVSTVRDPDGRPRVIDLLPKDVGRVFNVGRLDLASEGLILVTNDGGLANRLTHPRHGVQKEYEVQVAGHADPEVLAQLRKGVYLSEGRMNAVRARIKSRRKNSTLLTIVLDEGRNREIRRMLAKIGHKVQRLTRVAVGPIRLGELPRGAVRKLTPAEVAKLRAAASGFDPKRTGQRGKPKSGSRSNQSSRVPISTGQKRAGGAVKRTAKKRRPAKKASRGSTRRQG